MIISVRGTSGSGKTHLARALMALYPSRQTLEVGGKLGGYLLGDRLRVFGPYDERVQASGADAMRRFSREQKFEIIGQWANQGDVFYEGLMEGNEVTRTVAQARDHTTHVIFLDHALEDCLNSINARRALRGVLEPVNPKKTEEKFEELKRVRVRLRQAGVTTHLVDRAGALNLVRGLLGV